MEGNVSDGNKAVIQTILHEQVIYFLGDQNPQLIETKCVFQKMVTIWFFGQSANHPGYQGKID